MTFLQWNQTNQTGGAILNGDGGELAFYNWGTEANNPAFHPVRPSGDGPVLTNRAPWDHRWHHGLWWSWKFVNDYLFWEDHPAYGGESLGLGKCVVREHSAYVIDGGRCRIDQVIDARTNDGILLRETRQLTLHPDSGSNIEGWAIDWHFQFKAVEDVVLRATPVTKNTPWGGYAGLSYRPARSMTSGESFVADGNRRGVEALHGYRARWAALSGNLDGSLDSTPDAPTQGGIALLSHPTNPCHPMPVYAFAFGHSGFLAMSPVFYEPIKLAADDQITFAFRSIAFLGEADPAKLEEAWATYAVESADLSLPRR